MRYKKTISGWKTTALLMGRIKVHPIWPIFANRFLAGHAPFAPPRCLPFEAVCNWPNSGHKFDLLFYFALRLNEAAGKWGLPIAAEQINESRMVGNLALAKDSIIDVCVLFWGFFSSPRCPSISNRTLPPSFQRFLH